MVKLLQYWYPDPLRNSRFTTVASFLGCQMATFLRRSPELAVLGKGRGMLVASKANSAPERDP